MMQRAWGLAAVSMLCACPAGTAPGVTSGAQTAPRTEDVKGDAKGDAKADAKGDAKAPEVAAPTVPGDDWLVWWFRDGGWTTRWLRVEGEKVTTVGERKALVVGDAGRAFQVERADREVRYLPCICFEADPNDAELKELVDCSKPQKMPGLGLRARPLDGSPAFAVHEAPKEIEFGDDISHGLEIVGGVQGRLFVVSSSDGYFCGAHGLTESSQATFDVALGKGAEPPAERWWRGLPAEMRRGAAEEILTAVKECDVGDAEDTTIESIMNEEMALSFVSMRLAKGVPTIAWTFEVFLPYVCSPDYSAGGGAESGLIPEAAALGLGTLPPAVAAAIVPIGEADRLGFSKLALVSPAREATVAAFLAAPETAWGPETVSDQDTPAANPAKDRLEEGRKLTIAKDYAKAIAAFDAALKLDPNAASGFSGRGYARLLAGDLAKAKADLDAALTRDARPEFQAAVYFNLGLLAEKKGDAAAAKAAYERSNSLRATKQAKAAIERLAAPK
jgi:hypothetical protein